MPKKRSFWQKTGIAVLIVVLILASAFVYLVQVSSMNPPAIADRASLSVDRVQISPGFFTLKNNWIRKSRSGLYELYLEGAPFERGVANGKLSRELLWQQEAYFNEQIARMVPSTAYLHFLKYVVGWFNRKLDKHVTEEYKEEIFGISQSASDQFDYIGSNYQRILNYHAAHDIGHALQNMALVGCTSFGTWGDRSEAGRLIIGRNFDFYVGDQFARNKIVSFEAPSSGYRFMSLTWAGFIGVVSGMNEKGLTVTINAAKSAIPYGAATPVSLVAREILQYAANIDEAYQIARQRKMFVSESFLVGSAFDHKAVLIEKTPDSTELYAPAGNLIICTNHFQSKGLGQTPSNLQQIDQSASMYRYRRLQELLDSAGVNTIEKTVSILRDRRGLQNKDIGLGNEKAINQLIAHHSIVFEPEKLIVWVSTSPWQLGSYVAYDLHKVFAMGGMKQDMEIFDSANSIAADPFLSTTGYLDFLRFRKFKESIAKGSTVDPDSLVAANPSFYSSYLLAGDYLFKQKAYGRAKHFYASGLTKVIATKKEEIYLQKMVDACAAKIKAGG